VRRSSLNSGFTGLDRRRTPDGVITTRKHFIERSLGTFRYSTGWTPLDLGTLAVWFDATDPATVTESGGRVSQWADKSGNLRHAVSAAGKYPWIGNATINGNATISSLVAGEHLWLDSSLFTAAATYFVVARWRTSGGGYNKLLGHTNSLENHNGGALFYRKSSNQWASYGLYDSGATFDGVGVNNHGTTYVCAYVSGTAGATNSRAIYVDGTALFSGTPTAFPAANTRISIHAGDAVSVANSQASLIDIGEVVVAIGNLSDENRQKAEGYLAHKWGTTSALPGGHPYKLAAP
jgi:hypothetical protein